MNSVYAQVAGVSKWRVSFVAWRGLRNTCCRTSSFLSSIEPLAAVVLTVDTASVFYSEGITFDSLTEN